MLTWTLLGLFGLGAFLYVYFFIWRPFAVRCRFLKLDGIYKRLDQIEAGWIAKFRITLSGLKRKIVVHLTTLAGLLPFAHDTILPWFGAQDITPLIDPDNAWLVPVALMVAGQALGWLIEHSPQPAGEVNPTVVDTVVAKSPGDDATLADDAAEATGMNKPKA